MPVGLPPSHAFQQRSSTGWYRSCSGTSLGVSHFYTSSLFLLLLWNHVCKGRWMAQGAATSRSTGGVFTSKPENRVLCCSGRGLHWVRCWHHHLPNAVIWSSYQTAPSLSLHTPVKNGEDPSNCSAQGLTGLNTNFLAEFWSSGSTKGHRVTLQHSSLRWDDAAD